MSWYYGTFSCGCEGRVNVIGKEKDRQWKVDRAFSNMCEECYKKYLEEQRAKANAEALEKAKEMELPELTGTEKQVAWANTLRDKFLEKLSQTIEDVNGKDKYDSIYTYRKIFKIKKIEDERVIKERITDYLYKFQDMFLENTKATYFINNRFNILMELIEEAAENVINLEEIKKEKEMKLEIIKETTVEPAEVKFDEFVEIVATKENIKLCYEKNETFRSIVTNLNFKWNYDEKCWTRKINELTGNYIDRSAEVANKLLNIGFRVAIPEIEIKEKALDGSYEQECNRWILHRRDTTKLAIKWYEGRNNDLYKACKHLKGARWDSGAMVIDVKNFEQIEEFAEMYGFKFTKEARKFVEQYKIQYEEQMSKIEKVNVVEVEDKKEKNGLEDILNSSREVLDDLAEED